MAWSFGDGFDLYTAVADMQGSYWDSGSPANMGITSTGRFTGSRGLAFGGATAILTKTSAVNDAVHHFAVAFLQTSAMGAATTVFNMQLKDGATVQCTIQFRVDGSITLVSGTGGATLATYTGAFTANNTWYHFEFEVVIHNSAGSFKVRKNGSPSDDHSTTGINTRGGTANNYANTVTVGTTGLGAQQIDDFFWKSDASSVAWLGDIRCDTRRPFTDSAVTWLRSGSGTGWIQSVGGWPGQQSAIGNTQIRLQSFVSSYNGLINSIIFVTDSGASGNMKAAIWADNSGNPAAVLASAGPITAVAAGSNVFTISPPVSVTLGQKIWIGALCDTSAGLWYTSYSPTTGAVAPATYATFPQANPVGSLNQWQLGSSLLFASPTNNAAMVSELQQDATTTYVYSSTAGDADLYGINTITSTPATVIATTVRAYVTKSDAGTRTAAVQLKSGATTVASPTVVLTTSGWQWAWRTDLTDPNTGAAWTPSAVNSMQVGPKVIA